MTTTALAALFTLTALALNGVVALYDHTLAKFHAARDSGEGSTTAGTLRK
jgi:hypothetical protein